MKSQNKYSDNILDDSSSNEETKLPGCSDIATISSCSCSVCCFSERENKELEKDEQLRLELYKMRIVK
jgi:hypothetical protein